MNDWHLSSIKLNGVTTDNGSNMLKVVDTLHWCHMPCFSHTLQLAVQVAMKLSAVSRAIARCKRLINHFHHSVQSTPILRSKQKSLKHPQHSLIQEVSTRWKSSYYMMERIIMQQQPIYATLLEIKRPFKDQKIFKIAVLQQLKLYYNINRVPLLLVTR